MLATTPSSELVEWFVFLRLEDERMYGTGDREPEVATAELARRAIEGI